MAPLYVRMMNKLYWLCIGIAMVSICVSTILVFLGTMTRDLFGFGAMYSEQISIMFAIQMTFYGAAACYRAHVHLSLSFFVNRLPPAGRNAVRHFVHILFLAISGAMIYWGIELVLATTKQHYAEFPWEGLKVGYIYAAVPISGLVTLLFVAEQIFFKEARQFHGDDGFGAETDTDIVRRAQEGQV